jgi:hypothetical protein
MMIVVMITVVMVVMAVAGIRDRGWGTTFEICVAVRPVDVDVRSRPTFFLCKLLCCRRREAMFVRVMRFVMR